jgi:hypothetical protein
MFKELYYWMFWYIKKLNTKSPRERAQTASLLMSMLEGFNIEAVAGAMNHYLKIDLQMNQAVYITIFLAIVLIITNYFYLFSNREKIFAYYDREMPVRRRKGKLLFWIYVILTAFLMSYLGSHIIKPRY